MATFSTQDLTAAPNSSTRGQLNAFLEDVVDHGVAVAELAFALPSPRSQCFYFHVQHLIPFQRSHFHSKHIYCQTNILRLDVSLCTAFVSLDALSTDLDKGCEKRSRAAVVGITPLPLGRSGSLSRLEALSRLLNEVIPKYWLSTNWCNVFESGQFACTSLHHNSPAYVFK